MLAKLPPAGPRSVYAVSRASYARLSRAAAPASPRPRVSGTVARASAELSEAAAGVAKFTTIEMATTGEKNTLPLDKRCAPVRVELEELTKAALAAAFPDATDAPLVAPCNNLKNGDYQINNAMGLFGRMKGKEGAPKNPRAVAEAIIANLPATDVVTEKPTIAGPGFINLKLSGGWMAARISAMLKDGIGTWAPPVAPKSVVVDFSSPNVAKEMHVGHLRSTIIGDTLCRLLAFCGHDVTRLNHIGDWGTQFGMLIQHMADTNPRGLEGAGEEGVSDLMKLYRDAKKRFDEDEEFKTRARNAVTDLQSGRPEYLAAWTKICEASRVEFQAIYERLGVVIDERGESFYNPMLKPLVERLSEEGVAEESDGCKCIFVEGYDVPLIIQKSDGGFGYASTDLAAVEHRVKEMKSDWVIYVTDAGQSQHFAMVFAGARKAGILPPAGAEGPRVDHVPFGLVLGEDGKRFRTRSGDVVRLVELLDEAYDRIKGTIKERRPDIPEDELDFAAKAMGYGAVKYADLKNSRTTNYKFSYDAMLDLKGNTAVYLLYAHARIASIGRKSGRNIDELVQTAELKLEHPNELALAMHILKFPEAVEAAVEELGPNRLTDFLYDLSVRFNEFYQECQVLGSDSEDSRLLLCEATAVCMRACFGLLGITPLMRI